MKKRGFTLIEALAVIVILALITVIAIPTITRLVDNTKKESFVTSVHNLMESFESLNKELNNAYSLISLVRDMKMSKEEYDLQYEKERKFRRKII